MKNRLRDGALAQFRFIGDGLIVTQAMLVPICRVRLRLIPRLSTGLIRILLLFFRSRFRHAYCPPRYVLYCARATPVARAKESFATLN